LEEIARELASLDLYGEHPQVAYNARHLLDLISEALDGRASRSYKAAPVSGLMLNSPFVRALLDALAGRVTLDVSGSLGPGDIRAETRAEKGFSLRVYSRKSTDRRSLSVLNQTRGRSEVRFPSRSKLAEYLPGKDAPVERLAAFLAGLGGDIFRAGFGKQVSIPLELLERHVVELAEIVLQLASPSWEHGHGPSAAP
jgi:hypothetical protein